MPETTSGAAPILNRRTLLAGGIAGLGWAALSGAPGRAATKKVPVVDAHLHCFAGKADRRFPYHERAPYRPETAATPEHLLKCMDGAGVDYGIVVHPEPYQDDHRYLEHCLAVGKGRLKGTCLFFADRPGSVARMPALVKKWPIVAVRIHAYAPERLPPFGKPELRALWKQAGDLGLAVQLHLEPRYAPRLEPYIKEFSAVRVVIDHLGRPFDGTAAEHAVIVRWARFKNTYMKVSSLPEKKADPRRDVVAILRRLAGAFGPERMLYGGGFDSEATAASYRRAREQTARYLSFLSAADRAKVLGGTAARLFGFGS